MTQRDHVIVNGQPIVPLSVFTELSVHKFHPMQLVSGIHNEFLHYLNPVLSPIEANQV